MSTQTSAASTRLEQQQQQTGSLSTAPSSTGSDYYPPSAVAARVRPQLGNAARKVTTKIAAASGDNEVQNNAKADDDDDDEDVDSEPESGNVERRADAVSQQLSNQNLEPNKPLSQPNQQQQQQRRYNRISMIIFYGREALCVLALILTTYASIQNSPPRISKAPPPAPFFSRGSLVHDWPSGALGPTQTRVSQSELSLVFYYAPWCAESQHARSVYEHVAQLYYREAHFAAINCWQPGGECRLQYSKVQSWPVLMAYQPNGMAVQFHGAWTNSALARFVQSLIEPIHRMTGPGDLMSFMTGKDAVVVAFLDAELDRRQYSRFYQTSLKWLEKDPFQEVAFGVVTGESVGAFGVEEVPTIQLYLWNETIQYHGNTSWTTPEVTAWINKHIQVVSMWIAPPGSSKSASLAPYFAQGPVLFLFSPRSLYGPSSDAYMMLRQLGMQYYNCRGDLWVQEMATKYIAEQRRVSAELYGQLREECNAMLKRHPAQDGEDEAAAAKEHGCGKSSAISVSFVSVLNSSKFAEGKQKQNVADQNGYCDIECDARFFECGGVAEDRGGCAVARAKRKHSGLYGEGGRSDEETRKPVSSMLNAEQDYRGPKLLRRFHARRECELLRLNEMDHSEVFFREKENEDDVGAYLDLVKGLSCKYNKTLTFLGMDSALYHAFAERLGVDVLNEPNQSVAIIVDHEDESSYLLRRNITLASMAKLVHGFYNRTYGRFRRSSNVSFANTHSFNMHELRKESRRMVDAKRSELEAQQRTAEAASQNKVESTSQEQQQQQDGKGSSKKRDDSAQIQHHQHHSVREINAHNFHHVVVNSNKTVVVHFYSAHCAFCSVLSQHLLTISRMLRAQPRLEFVRIDGDRNDLRWEYSMDAFPTLIIFPNQRKSESRVFSRQLQMTVPNVLGFILSNLSPPERLHATAIVCESTQVSSSPAAARDDCLVALKRELSDSISLNLRLYRVAAGQRPVRAARILQRLQLLQEFYLGTLRCLSHSCDFNQLKSSAKTILNLWQIAA
uniref:Putative conserved plasma membrane protein n=1 Tax=Culex tarsalis TaxID=7177 RepID=A0A1Q3FF51_CULTA